ncbi:MAG: hypothetical protein R3332_02345 [Pseudohongiellaceae bacterium]|nr:hypothetical protein [Pseudohongiellaceae bacterium]
MTIRRLLASTALMSTFALFACATSAQDVAIDYEYTQKPQVDFSPMPKGAMKLSTFSDTRAAEESHMIGSVKISEPVATIVQDALTQAFIAGGAKLVDSDQSLTLNGEITEASFTESSGEYDVIIRTKVTLMSGSRSAFNTVIFGRAKGSSVEEAARAALDKLVNSLIWDDYFLMEVI